MPSDRPQRSDRERPLSARAKKLNRRLWEFIDSKGLRAEAEAYLKEVPDAK